MEDAIKTYIEEARDALVAASADGEYTTADEERLLDLYTLLVLVKGEEVTLEDVHDAWAVWRSRTRRDHPSIVPFDDLTKEIQDYDAPYAEAIKLAAKGS